LNKNEFFFREFLSNPPKVSITAIEQVRLIDIQGRGSFATPFSSVPETFAA
jgi:hypothetical protein